MALHDKDTFIRTYSPGDNTVIIQDVNDSVTYELKPWHVNAMYVRPKSKSIIIKQKGSDYNPDINFESHSEALQALTLLQTAIDMAKGVMDNIPDEIRDYIDNQIMIVIESGKFAFRQSFSSENWNVYNHGMDKKPSVTITDDNFEVIEGYVQYIDDDNVEVKFNVPLTGWVFLN
jgi:hypothetical protein